MKKYFTEEERKAAHREADKRWREKNKEKMAEYQKLYYQKNKEKISVRHAAYRQNNKEREAVRHAVYHQKNKEKISVRHAAYRSTPYGRAFTLNNHYKQSDKNANRGECTLTARWIVNNIFSKPCHYCGETDWKKIGCDRIDNTKPHTPSNVVPCCGECNVKRNTTSYDEFMKRMGKVI